MTVWIVLAVIVVILLIAVLNSRAKAAAATKAEEAARAAAARERQAAEQARKARDAARDFAIREGKAAAQAGQSEDHCPYRDDFTEPPKWPIGALLSMEADKARGLRFWWLASYRSTNRELDERSKKAQPPPQPAPPSAPAPAPAAGESAQEFLYPLSKSQKVAVSGLSPTMYQAFLQIKRSGAYSHVNTVNLTGDSGEDASALLMKVSAADIEKLRESMNLTIEADRAAELDPEKAEALYRKAVELNPFDAIAMMSCGNVIAMQGDLRQGIEWLERARSLDSTNARIQRNLDEARSAL